MKFKLIESNQLIITPTGLAIVGLLINNNTELSERVSTFTIPKILQSPDISNSDVFKSYLGLLSMGKSDFEAIEEYRENEFFKESLGVKKVPSCSTLRQRLDIIGESLNTIILEENIRLLCNSEVELTYTYKDYIAVDIDVSPFDNSNTKKEGVTRTYKGFDGYAPIFSYIGEEGYCLNMEFRIGKTHCQKGTPEYLKQTLLYAKQMTSEKLLVRLDSGNDSAENIQILRAPETSANFIIKRNLRHESKDEWYEIAKKDGYCNEPRYGKKVYLGSVVSDVKGVDSPETIVYEVIERICDKHGQMLIIPEIEVNTYWTSLVDECIEDTIELYHAHGTSEQFHSEIKTDLDLERLPSGKFNTNSLVLTMGIMAYNILRIIGQETLRKDDAPLKRKVLRRRIRTVIKNIITIASKFVKHANTFWLNFGRCSAWFPTFKRLYLRFST
jgi:hypothetical protein